MEECFSCFNPHEKFGRVKSNNLMAFDDIAETAGFPQNGGSL
jgi:hypothetical protein